jgi:hypothetical protein
MEAGLIQKWKQVFWPRDDECSTTARGTQTTTVIVNVSDMQGSFYILMLGKQSSEIQIAL